MQRIDTRAWRQYGYGGPPERWHEGARRDIDRLATSYYLEILSVHRRLTDAGTAHAAELHELHATATRQKHEIDYALRHPATPVEQNHVEYRLGQLMRISRRLRALGPTHSAS